MIFVNHHPLQTLSRCKGPLLITLEHTVESFATHVLEVPTRSDLYWVIEWQARLRDVGIQGAR
jgi:hypothetical protein